jgi:hypothetical protein
VSSPRSRRSTTRSAGSACGSEKVAEVVVEDRAVLAVVSSGRVGPAERGAPQRQKRSAPTSSNVQTISVMIFAKKFENGNRHQ